MQPFISICIPAYKNASYLDVLLRSIESQTFRNYEVIVSDDSQDDEVEILCKHYSTKFSLQYHKNSPAKGSPANWNMVISLAKGEWIKMMHDDDWFAGKASLAAFAGEFL
jgi:glycosyltransferase involved in cell wall biosynthesis